MVALTVQNAISNLGKMFWECDRDRSFHIPRHGVAAILHHPRVWSLLIAFQEKDEPKEKQKAASPAIFKVLN